MRPVLATIGVAVLGLGVSGCAFLDDTDASSLATRATAIAVCMRHVAPDLAATARADRAASDARSLAARIEAELKHLSRLSVAIRLVPAFLAPAEELAPRLADAWAHLADETAHSRAFHPSAAGISPDVIPYLTRGAAAYDAGRISYLAMSGGAEAALVLASWAGHPSEPTVRAHGGDAAVAAGSVASEAPVGHLAVTGTDQARAHIPEYLGRDDAFNARTQLAVLAAKAERLFSPDADIHESIGAAFAAAHKATDALPDIEQTTIVRAHADHDRLVAKLAAVEAAARRVPSCVATGPLQAFGAPDASPLQSVNAQGPTASHAP